MKTQTKRITKKKRTKRRTNKRQMGGNQIVIRYNNVPIQGQKLEKDKTTSAPSVEFTKTGKLYTLVMWDPDVPPQIQPGFAHWIATNIQSPFDITNNQLLEYKGPNPPSGIHRYYFGLFEQNGHISPQQPPRTNFNIGTFLNENNLKKISEVYMKVAAI